MFEGKPLRADASPPAGESGQTGEALRPMTWSDLVARLAAARDLRKELAADRDEEAASFDVYSARCLAERAGEKEFVNPETSTNRKGIGPISVESVETDTDGLPAETRGNR